MNECLMKNRPLRRCPILRLRRKFRMSASVIAVLLLLLSAPASLFAAAGSPDTLHLATGSVGGTFLPVGQVLAAWWGQSIDGIVVVVDTTAGSVDNLDRLIKGEADLAIVGSAPFREILDGWGTHSDEAQELCSVGTLYTDAEQYVVRSDLVRAGNLLDLSGLHMYPGPHNSGGEIDTRVILSTLGIEPRFVYVDERDKGYTAAAAALARGDFDAATFSGGVPIQALTELFRRYPGEFQILPFSKHMLRRLTHYEQGYQAVAIHAGSYPGQVRDIPTVGGPNLLVASPRIDKRLLADLDQAVREGIETPGVGLRAETSHPVLRVLTLDHWNRVPMGRRCPCLVTADLQITP